MDNPPLFAFCSLAFRIKLHIGVVNSAPIKLYIHTDSKNFSIVCCRVYVEAIDEAYYNEDVEILKYMLLLQR